MTAADMIKSLQKQALATQNWASNLKIAAERGIDQGLLKKLADAGPESAGYLQVIANMTDDQIEEMNRAWRDRYNASQYAAEEMADVQTSIYRPVHQQSLKRLDLPGYYVLMHMRME